MRIQSIIIQILKEFTAVSRRSTSFELAYPNIRSTLTLANRAIRNNNCSVLGSEENKDKDKDKALRDTELIFSIGKAIGKSNSY